MYRAEVVKGCKIRAIFATIFATLVVKELQRNGQFYAFHTLELLLESTIIEPSTRSLVELCSPSEKMKQKL